MDPRIRRLVEKLWTYHQLNHQLAHADVILVLCSHDRAVAERGAQLLLEDWAPLLIFSGGLGSITKHLWNEPEANQFAEIAMRMGVAPEKILIENRSTNTGENILFTKQLLAGRASTRTRSSSCRSRTWSDAATRRSRSSGLRRSCW